MSEKFHITEVVGKASVNPIMFTFQNGYTNNNFSGSECQLFSDSNNPESKTVLTTIDGMLYAGEEKREKYITKCLLVRDRTTGKCRLVEHTRVQLKPILIDNLVAMDEQETSYLELSRKFGSKKQKQKVEHHEKLKVNTETVQKQMKKIKASVVQEDLDLSSYSKTDSEDIYVPPINRQATRVEDVYEIDKMLTEDEYEKIYSELSEKDYESELMPFVKELIQDRTLHEKHIVLVVYASSLLKMYGMNSKDIQKVSFFACNHSHCLNKIIFANFTSTSNKRRTRPSQLRDKALCHAMVFLLTINNFKLSLDTFSAANKMTVSHATIKARAIGAHIVNVSAKKYIQLKIPLNTTTGFNRRKSAKF